MENTTATQTHIEELTAETILISFDGVLAHMTNCPEAIGHIAESGSATADIFVKWGEGFFPAGCCIDVDAVPYGLTDSIVEFLGTGGGSGTKIEKKDLTEVDPATEAEVIAVIEALNGKFTPADATPALIGFAQNWLAEYDGDFEFLIDVRSKTTKSGMSAGQAKGVLNCIRAAYFRGEFGTRNEKDEKAETGLDLTGIPAGMYAVPGGDTNLKVKIDNVTKGKWNGWVFVKDGAEYGYGQKYGAQKPGNLYRGDITEELAIILKDPQAAAAAYGHLVGRCGVCNRVLEDPESVARGIGPVCLTKF